MSGHVEQQGAAVLGFMVGQRWRVLPGCWALLVSLLLASVQPLAAAETPANAACVWRVTGSGQAQLYLLGSLHVLPPSALPLPEVMQAAYADSSVLVTEADIGQLQSPQGQAVLLGLGQYQGGRSLADDLDAVLYQQVLAVATRQGLSQASLRRLKPWMLAAVLSVNEMARYGLFPQFGVDLHWHTRAIADGKPRLALEDLPTHAAVLGGLSLPQQVAFLRLTLRDLAVGKPLVDQLLQSWTRCDEAAISRLLNESLGAAPEVGARLLQDRNRNWLPQLEKMLAGEQDVLVVVGAGHLVGKDSVVDLLRQRGYQVVKQVPTSTAP